LLGKPRRGTLLAGIVCLALAVSGCGQHPVADRADAGGGEPASASASGDNGDGTYNAPRVRSSPAVSVAHESPFTAYNNTAAETRTVGNTVVLNQVLVDPFVLDGEGNFLLNSDVLVSAELTSQDPQVVTYQIKPDITWSDGAAWDCDDFYLAWLAASGKAVERGIDGQPVVDPEGNEMTYFRQARTAGQQWSSGACLDAQTFVETYAAPYGDWRRNYIQNTILPAHILERVTGIPDITALGPESAQADLRKAGDAWSKGWLSFHADTMPASGPYRIESTQPGGQVILVRNEKWAGNPGGPERIVVTPVADGAAAVQGLQNREFTVVTPPADPVLADRLRTLSGQGIVLEIRGGSSAESLHLNLARPLLRDIVVRAAFAECIDRNKLVEELVRRVLPAAQPLGSLAFLPGAENYEDRYAAKMPADAQQAQLTLERAGWVLGEDGVYSRNGQRMSFVISHDGSPSHARAVELIRMHCRQAGMEILDGTVPGGLAAVLAEGAFDVLLTTNSLIPQVESMADRYRSAGRLNHQNYSNPDVDDALRVAEREYSESFQAEAILKADQLVADDLVSLPLFQIPIMWAYRDNIQNVFQHGSDGVTWNANEWEIG